MICDQNNLEEDYFLLRDGPIVVMSDRELWQAGVNWLRTEKGYPEHSWQLGSKTDFFEEVSKTFAWNQQFGYPNWGGNLDALNDAARSWQVLGANRVVIAIDNAERLKPWLNGMTDALWDILQGAAREQLLFGVGLIVMVNTSSCRQARQWANQKHVAGLHRKSYPGSALFKAASKL